MRRRVILAAAAVALTAVLAGCGIRGDRAGDPGADPAPATSSESSTVDVEAMLEQLDTVDAGLEQADADVSAGQAAEAEED